MLLSGGTKKSYKIEVFDDAEGEELLEGVGEEEGGVEEEEEVVVVVGVEEDVPSLREEGGVDELLI